MYEFSRLKTKDLDAVTKDTYESFLQEKHRKYLLEPRPHERKGHVTIAIGATYCGKPIGIILANLDKSIRRVTILDLFVDPEYRKQHIGTNLLKALQSEAGMLGGGFIRCIYPLQDPSTIPIEKIFTSCGWKDKQPYFTICQFNVFEFNIPWVIHSKHTYPAGFTVFPWSELTSEEHQDLQQREYELHFKPIVSPLAHEDEIEHLNSVGLRYQGQVVGWMICHRIAPDTIQYSALYVQPHLKNHGLIMATLLIDSMKRHLTARNHWATFEIPLHEVPASWVNFVNRRLIPFADKVTHTVEGWYNLDK